MAGESVTRSATDQRSPLRLSGSDLFMCKRPELRYMISVDFFKSSPGGMFMDFRERGREGEKEKERNIYVRVLAGVAQLVGAVGWSIVA